MEDCSIVQVRQLENALSPKMLYVCMFGSLWNVAAAHEHRRQDSSRRPGTVAKCQTTTGERTVTDLRWSWNRHSASLMDMCIIYSTKQPLPCVLLNFLVINCGWSWASVAVSDMVSTVHNGGCLCLLGWLTADYTAGWFELSSVLRPREHSIGHIGDGFTGQKTQPTAR